MKHKVSELDGALLDAAVLRAGAPKVSWSGPGCPPYSSVWALGGQIIERERITIVCDEDSGRFRWTATVSPFYGYIDEPLPLTPTVDSHPFSGFWSATPLIAAMRAYVASKLGDEVELP